MSDFTDYGLAMDYVRERFGFPVTTSMYEIVVRLTNEFQILEEIQKSQKEKLCQTKPKQLKSKSQK